MVTGGRSAGLADYESVPLAQKAGTFSASDKFDVNDSAALSGRWEDWPLVVHRAHDALEIQTQRELIVLFYSE